MNILRCLLILSALVSLLVTVPNLAPLQSYAAAADNGDYKITKDYKDSIHKDVNTKSDSTNQHSSQDNLCYSDDGCEQANEGGQIEGKDNAADGFNDQGKNAHQQPGVSGGLPTSTQTNSPPSPLQTGTLLATKNVTCPDGFSCPQPSDFTIRVTGVPGNGNPSPSSFAGSEEGTTVTLNVGEYNVTEDFEDSASSPLKVVRNFSAGCSGSIESVGQSRICNVTNEFAVKEYLFLDKWGSRGSGNGQFNSPTDVDMNPSTGNVFVADWINNRIQVFDSSGTFITKFGTLGSGNGQFNQPVGVAVNPITGSIYVVDAGNDRIQVFDSTGNFIMKWGSFGSGNGQFNNAVGVAVNPSTGGVYVADQLNDRIQVFDSTGNFIMKWGSFGSGNGQFFNPIDVAVNPSTGGVYVADTFNDRIQVFDSTGNFITSFGTLGSGNGQFRSPEGVAVNPSTGNVFVADTFNDRIQVFDSIGNFITKFGTAGSGNGQFNTAARVAVNPATGNVFVADQTNNRIQVFFLDP